MPRERIINMRIIVWPNITCNRITREPSSLSDNSFNVDNTGMCRRGKEVDKIMEGGEKAVEEEEEVEEEVVEEMMEVEVEEEVDEEEAEVEEADETNPA